MLRLASDADVHGDIIRGLRRRLPDIDLVRAQDALPEGTPDPEVLAWAAAENRVLITNDRNTMVGCAYQRVAAGEPVPGLIATTNEQAIGLAIDDILLVAECMPEEDYRRLADALPHAGRSSEGDGSAGFGVGAGRACRAGPGLPTMLSGTSPSQIITGPRPRQPPGPCRHRPPWMGRPTVLFDFTTKLPTQEEKA